MNRPGVVHFNRPLTNNTILGPTTIYYTVSVNEEYNYYGAPASASFGDVLGNGWLNPYYLEPNFPCSNSGAIERCTVTEPRNLPPLRSISFVAGQEVMQVEAAEEIDENYPGAFKGHLRAGQPLALAFFYSLMRSR